MSTILDHYKSKLLTIVGLLLILSLAGTSAVAQTDEPGGSDRDEGSGQFDRWDESGLDPMANREVTLSPLYHFSGVLDLAGIRGTAIMCTNLDTLRTTLIEVKLYDYDSTLVDTATKYVGPLNTVTIESTPILYYDADVGMYADEVEQGYGLVSTEHSNVICTVQILDPIHDPPLWMESLPVYGRSSCCSFLPVILN